ncbi:Predicted thiol-disulfide oxidoreductase YuxK, DCC family [Nocardiopsis flavescens]|uniref:Predicted thiol-disulfide oxidoreductase YuxK, DCC family n=1 Tax=Nocardiopsis flavescens TaxID=758803 RepID=A0A1M6IB53_9ACTN|nr:DUF393 domain-containing protein [Nocardiopsis flavescens]SHJ31647.1 Predicted thiol-disulfide oxidoreductase YuxK, DCC family [Nocardiopsis flavescens]
MSTGSPAGTFLYDDDCGFCKRMVAVARDRLGARTAFAAWQDTDLAALGLTPEQTSEAAWVVHADGRRLRGGDAVAEVLLHSRPALRPLGRLMRLPLLRSANRVAYGWVAAHRHRLPGGTASCALPRG